MADILTHSQVYQGSSAPTIFSDQLLHGDTYQGSSQACIIDVTPPTFAGISALTVESRGQIRAKWLAATDPTPPIRYEVYIQASTNVGLFTAQNIISITDKLQYDTFTMPDGSFLVNGTVYYVGVRAIDGVNNRDGNTVIMSVISTGVSVAADMYQTKAEWSIDDSNQFRITMWANKNGVLANAPDDVLGTASYQVYDKLGAPIVGMSGSGITANSQGLYVAPAIPNLLADASEHYEIKVTINVDGEDRINYVEVEGGMEIYSIDGVASLDSSSNLIGSFWVAENENVITTDLGTGSFQTYTADGTLIPGLSETGITPDVNGFFTVTPIPLPPSLDTSQSYIVRVTLQVHGETKTHNIVINASPTTYTCKATFSINALNQLEATFWSTVNDELTDPALLGTASYQVYDKLGVAVAGLTQSGITPDVQGMFHITPVAATLLTDLTHYSVKVTINVAGQDRTVIKGFTLLGT